MVVKKYVARKLFQLSRWVYDTERHEQLYIADKDGLEVFRSTIVANDYGFGVQSWNACLPEGLTVHLGEDCRPEVLDDGDDDVELEMDVRAW